jgi:hypothetical protein
MINTTTATMSELRAFATANDITIDGDKRLKASYQSAINNYLAFETSDPVMDMMQDMTSVEILATIDAWDALDSESSEVSVSEAPVTSTRTIISAAVPLIVMLGIAIKLVLWFLDISTHTARFVKRQVRRTVAGRATKAYLTRVWVDALQFANGLLYGI